MQDDAPIAPTETAHQRGIRLFQEARFEEAAHELAESLQENQNSETWNDWAVAELNAGHSKAETGFRSALALDAENYEAAANLGALLANSGRHAEAILYLEKALGHADQQPVVLKQLLDSCSRKAFSENMLRESGETARKFAASVQEYPAPATSQVEPRPAFDGSPSAIATLKQEISRIDWYHQIGLGQGIVTPGCHDSNRELRTLQLPERLDGLKVLDIGAWDGFFSFEAERRGATRVLATDGFVWRGRCPRASKRGFDLARWALSSNVESQVLDIAEIAPGKTGSFDVVLLDGLYDLRRPLAAFDRAFSVTTRLLIFRTYINLHELDRPALAYYPHFEFEGYPTNWWSPNRAAVAEMLRAVGFRKVTEVTPDTTRVACLAQPSMLRDKAVFHAER